MGLALGTTYYVIGSTKSYLQCDNPPTVTLITPTKLHRVCVTRPSLSRADYENMLNRELRMIDPVAPVNAITQEEYQFEEGQMLYTTYSMTKRLDRKLTWLDINAYEWLDGVDWIRFKDILRIREGITRPPPEEGVDDDALEIHFGDGRHLMITHNRALMINTNQKPTGFGLWNLPDERWRPFTTVILFKLNLHNVLITRWQFLHVISTTTDLYMDETNHAALSSMKPVKIYLNPDNFVEIYLEFRYLYCQVTSDEQSRAKIKSAIGRIVKQTEWSQSAIEDADRFIHKSPDYIKNPDESDMYPPESGICAGINNRPKQIRSEDLHYFPESKRVSVLDNNIHYVCSDPLMYPHILKTPLNVFGYYVCCNDTPQSADHREKVLSEEIIIKKQKTESQWEFKFLGNHFSYTSSSSTMYFPDSFWRACLTANGTTEWSREQALQNKNLYFACMSQELPDMSDWERKSIFLNPSVKPEQIIRAYELIFGDVNIYIIEKAGQYHRLICPGCHPHRFYIKQHRQFSPTWVFLRYRTTNRRPWQYTFLAKIDETQGMAFHEKFLETYPITTDGNIVFDQWSRLPVSNIFGRHLLHSQFIDTQGLMRGVNINFNNELVTVLVTPSQPFNLPIATEMYAVTTAVAKAIFLPNDIESLSSDPTGYGIWCGWKEYPEVFYIPVTDKIERDSMMTHGSPIPFIPPSPKRSDYTNLILKRDYFLWMIRWLYAIFRANKHFTTEAIAVHQFMAMFKNGQESFQQTLYELPKDINVLHEAQSYLQSESQFNMMMTKRTAVAVTTYLEEEGALIMANNANDLHRPRPAYPILDYIRQDSGVHNYIGPVVQSSPPVYDRINNLLILRVNSDPQVGKRVAAMADYWDANHMVPSSDMLYPPLIPAVKPLMNSYKDWPVQTKNPIANQKAIIWHSAKDITLALPIQDLFK